MIRIVLITSIISFIIGYIVGYDGHSRDVNGEVTKISMMMKQLPVRVGR